MSTTINNDSRESMLTRVPHRCWEAQAAQSLLAKYPHLEVVSASCEGEINLPQDAR